MKNSTRPNNPELDATKVPTEIDIAWAAGIYEGEGCCRLCGRGKRSFMANVTQKDPELLYRLRDWFGGNIGKARSSGVRNWDICGDRARIFIALIYKFMTARRRAQIDSTNALDFLYGQTPANFNIIQLRSMLDRYYEEHREMVRERRRKAAKEAYLRVSSDPEWKKKDREKKEAMRRNMTPEQKQASLDYAKDWYQRNKKLVEATQIEKTA